MDLRPDTYLKMWGSRDIGSGWLDHAMLALPVHSGTILRDFYTCTTGFEKTCGAELYSDGGALHTTPIWHTLGIETAPGIKFTLAAGNGRVLAR